MLDVDRIKPDHSVSELKELCQEGSISFCDSNVIKEVVSRWTSYI